MQEHRGRYRETLLMRGPQGLRWKQGFPLFFICLCIFRLLRTGVRYFIFTTENRRKYIQNKQSSAFKALVIDVLTNAAGEGGDCFLRNLISTRVWKREGTPFPSSVATFASMRADVFCQLGPLPGKPLAPPVCCSFLSLHTW